METYKFEKKDKYLVLKQEDIASFLTPLQKVALDDICDTIGYRRKQLHKDINKYVVVNENEPYAKTVWALIEEYEKLDIILDTNKWYRADGRCICKECGEEYKVYKSLYQGVFHQLCKET